METATIKKHSKGLLKDGRAFEIIDFNIFNIADDGTIRAGSIGVVIDEKYITTSLSMLAKNIDYENFNMR